MNVRAGDDDLDLTLSNIEAGLRLLSFLQDRMGPDDQRSTGPGQAFLLEALMRESAAARDAYDRHRREGSDGEPPS